MTTTVELDGRVVPGWFADAVNRRCPDEAAALFTADGRWDLPGLPPTVGPAAAQARLTEFLGAFPVLLQLVHPGRLDPTGDGFVGRTYVHEVTRTEAGERAELWGVYHDVIVRQGGEWRFAHRRFERLHRDRPQEAR